MQRERIADDVTIFTSERYAQVTASLILTEAGGVLIDTLPFPEETREMKRYIETRLNIQVRFIVYTHHHADHTYGAHFFPGAMVISHALCFDLINTKGRAALEKARKSTSEFQDVELVLPGLVFKHNVMTLQIGEKTFQLWHTPGHSADSAVCLLKDERILFGGDTLMPIPYFADGDYQAFVTTLDSLRGCNFENIVQGHGDIVLKGEIEDKIKSDLVYLSAIKGFVEAARQTHDPLGYLQTIGVEQCGKSRIALYGEVNELHQVNMRVLLREATRG